MLKSVIFNHLYSMISSRTLHLMISDSSYSQFKALVQLLDDPDTDVYQNVRGKLVSFGKHVVPLLETEWEKSNHLAIQERIEVIIEDIEFDTCKNNLIQWNDSAEKDLLDGVLVTSSFQYPDIDRDLIVNQLEVLRKDIWLELNDNLTSLEKVRVMNHILFDVHGFKVLANYRDSYHWYYISNLLDQHYGGPAVLSILYKILADKLDLPVVALDLPNHFILGYSDIYNATGNEMLFYINPSSKGAVFGRGELERFLEQTSMNLHYSDLKSMSNNQIIKRLLLEKKNCYHRLGKYQKTDQANKLIQVLSKDNI